VAKRRADQHLAATQPVYVGEHGWRIGNVDPPESIAQSKASDPTAESAQNAESEEIEIMIATLSHDLRAPLRAIDAYMRLLGYELGDSSNDKALAYIERTCRSVELAQDLLQELLDFLRCRHAPLLCEDIDLSAMAQTILEELRIVDPERVVSMQIEPGMRACGDPRLIRRLLHNLLGNAWTFT
jgi:signal transduction histidine kinase